MITIIKGIFKHLKGQKTGYVLGVILVVVLITETPLRDTLLNMVNIGTHSRQLKTAAAIGDLRGEVDGLVTRQQRMETTLDNTHVFQLMTIITNNNLPISLRLQAYDEYTKLGYNSWVHEYYDREVKPLAINVMHYRLEQLKN